MPLTPRQLQILIFYGRGMRRPEISRILHIGERTIDRQLEEIRSRLGTRTIPQHIVVALSRGYLELDDEAESVSLPELFVA